MPIAAIILTIVFLIIVFTLQKSKSLRVYFFSLPLFSVSILPGVTLPLMMSIAIMIRLSYGFVGKYTIKNNAVTYLILLLLIWICISFILGGFYDGALVFSDPSADFKDYTLSENKISPINFIKFIFISILAFVSYMASTHIFDRSFSYFFYGVVFTIIISIPVVLLNDLTLSNSIFSLFVYGYDQFSFEARTIERQIFDFFRLSTLTGEPSFTANILIAVLYFISVKKSSLHLTKFISAGAFILVSLFLTQSFYAYATFVVLPFLFLSKFITIPMMVSVIYLFNSIDFSIYGSLGVRIDDISFAIEQAATYPLGLGFLSHRSTSAFFSLLVGIGIPGATLLIIIIFKITKNINSTFLQNLYLYYILSSLLVIPTTLLFMPWFWLVFFSPLTLINNHEKFVIKKSASISNSYQA